MSAGEPSFDDRLLDRLREAGLVPSPETYGDVRPAITRMGETERERVRATAGPAWDAVVAMLPSGNPRADTVRVLGFGRALTAFAVAPLDLPEGPREDVVRLGAMANLLVATFDDLVDAGVPPGRVLSRRRLRAAGSTSRLLRGLATVLGLAPSRAMGRLVAWYFTRLRALPHVEARPSVLATHRADIARMYRAERRTLSDRQDAVDNWITSVYPFVVMGRPGWLATSTLSSGHYRRHVDWLRELGEFVGLLDDAVDRWEDQAAGAFNATTTRRSVDDDEVVLDDVVDRGRRVLEEWTGMTADVDVDAATRAALSTCVASWFGGLIRA